jgi:hypothetical protein
MHDRAIGLKNMWRYFSGLVAQIALTGAGDKKRL